MRKKGGRESVRERQSESAFSAGSVLVLCWCFLCQEKEKTAEKERKECGKNGNTLHTGGQEGHAFTVHYQEWMEGKDRYRKTRA